jgi:hypothetical protein
MECFGSTDFDNNSRLIILSLIIISSLHCISVQIGTFSTDIKISESPLESPKKFSLICLVQSEPFYLVKFTKYFSKI